MLTIMYFSLKQKYIYQKCLWARIISQTLLDKMVCKRHATLNLLTVSLDIDNEMISRWWLCRNPPIGFKHTVDLISNSVKLRVNWGVCVVRKSPVADPKTVVLIRHQSVRLSLYIYRYIAIYYTKISYKWGQL